MLPYLSRRVARDLRGTGPGFHISFHTVKPRFNAETTDSAGRADTGVPSAADKSSAKAAAGEPWAGDPAGENEFPGENTLLGQVLKLKEDQAVHISKLDGLTQKLDLSITENRANFQRIDANFARFDRWVMVLVGAFILKGGYEVYNRDAKKDGK